MTRPSADLLPGVKTFLPAEALDWILDGPQAKPNSRTGRTVISDIETNGLLDELDRIHCAGAIDIHTGEQFDWRPDQIDDYVRFMQDEVVLVIGHNFLSFDRHAIKKVYPDFKCPPVLDTLVLCKMIWPSDVLMEPDMIRFRKGTFPAKYIKRHSLGAWGYRTGDFKDEYSGGWEAWSEEMHDYLKQDCRANFTLLKLVLSRLGWLEDTPQGAFVWPWLPVWIEHETQAIIDEQERTGWWFDVEKAQRLSSHLHNLKAEYTAELQRIFGSWYQGAPKPTVPARDMARECRDDPEIIIRRFSEKTGKELKPYVGHPKEYYFEGAPYTKITWTTFNPSNRNHLGDRLQRLYGWVPTEWTTTGKPQVDEGSIKAIPEDVIGADTKRTIMNYFVVDKTLAMLADGKQAWMEKVKPDHRIHHIVDPLGTVTGRGAHRNPNLGQVPSVEVEEKKDPETRKVLSKRVLKGLEGYFGYDCRELFAASPGMEQSGTDASSLELINLGHYLSPLDEGAFSARVCDPTRDPHQEHGELTGLGRAPTKTATYAYVYGAGDSKLGFTVGFTEAEMPALLKDKSLRGILAARKRFLKDKYEEPSDREKAAMAKGRFVKTRFEEAITGLKFLKDSIVATAKERGWLKAIDGRKLHVRKPHAALNTLLQAMGAIVCKLWMVLFHQEMRKRGYTLGIHYNQLGWIHDELQFEHIPGMGPVIAEVSLASIKEAGRILGVRGEFRSDTKTGHHWADTH